MTLFFFTSLGLFYKINTKIEIQNNLLFNNFNYATIIFKRIFYKYQLRKLMNFIYIFSGRPIKKIYKITFNNSILAFNTLTFLDPGSPLYEGMLNLHNDIMGILIFIMGFVFVFICFSVHYFNIKKYKLTKYYTGVTFNKPLEFI